MCPRLPPAFSVSFVAASITQARGGSGEGEKTKNAGNGATEDQHTVPEDLQSKSNAYEAAVQATRRDL